MNITSTAATMSHMVFTAETVSPRVGPSAASAAVGSTNMATSARPVTLKKLSFICARSLLCTGDGWPPGLLERVVDQPRTACPTGLWTPVEHSAAPFLPPVETPLCDWARGPVRLSYSGR